MKQWISTHMEWVSQISERILTCKNIQLQDYIDLITSPGQPLDEIALLLISRMYHIHLRVFLKDTYWYTRADKDPKKCELMWAFRGSLQFDNTRQKDVGNEYELRSKNPPEETKPEGKENVSPLKGWSTFNSEKAGLDDKAVAELWKKYSRPTTASLSKIVAMPKATSKPKRKPKMEETKENSI